MHMPCPVGPRGHPPQRPSRVGAEQSTCHRNDWQHDHRGAFGFLVPVALKACHQDPPASSSIFVTTATDVLGFFIFLGMAQLFLPLLR